MPNLPFRKKLVAIATLAAMGQIAHAQSVSDAKPAELGAVTVSAGRGSKLEDMDMSTTIMSREQIQEAPQTSIEQIVSRIPGVFTPQQPTGQLHPTSQVFSIRGFGTVTTITTLLMVDGIPANDPYFRTIDWSQIPKDAIERIEVIRGGGATSLWGNMAMGGIVNIVTREPMPGEKRVNASYGDFNTRTGDLAATLFSSDQLRIGLTLGGTKSDGYNQTPAEYRSPKMVPTSSQAKNLSLSAHFTPTRDSKYFLKFAGHEADEKGQLWDITSNSWDKYQISGGGSTKLSGGGSVNMSAWYNESEMDTANAALTPAYNILNPAATVTAYNSQIEQAKYDSLGGSLFYQNDFGNIKDVKVGMDVRRIKIHDNNNFFNANGSALAHIVSRAEHRFEGIFVQGTYRPRDIPLDVTLGLREDFFQTDGGGMENTVGAGATVTNALANKSYSQFDPRLGAKYYFSDGLSARAAAYRNFAAPGMNQMYRSTRSGTNYLASNAALVPMDNRGREIGFDYVRSGFDLAFTAFHNKLQNFIDYVPVCSGTAGACDRNPAIVGTGFNNGTVTRINQYVNAGDAIIKGAELIANWQPVETVQINGGLTKTTAYLTRSDYAATPSTVAPAAPANVQLGQIPRWMATLGSNWQATPTLKLSLQLKHFPAFWNNTAHTQRNDGATLADVGLVYKVSKTIDIYGSIQNLGGKKYLDQGLTVTTMEGSTLSTSSVPALGMPFNATIGVRASF